MLAKGYRRRSLGRAWEALQARLAAAEQEVQAHRREIAVLVARRQAEGRSPTAEEQYHRLLESLDSVVVTVDPEGRLLYLNEVAAAKIGAPTQQWQGRTMSEIFPARVAQAQLAAIQKVLRDDRGAVLETPMLIEGEERWFRTSVQPLHDDQGRPVLALINATDITPLKTAQHVLQGVNQSLEAALRQHAAEVQDLYDHAPVGYHSLDADGALIRVNQTQLNWLGYTREELLGRPFTAIITPAGQATFQEAFAAFKQRGWVRDLEYELVRKDGGSFPALLSATAVYDDTGAFVMSRSTMTDETERMRAGAALRESEQRYRTLVEHLTQGVIVYQSGRVVFCNEAAAAIVGCRVEDLLGCSAEDLARLFGPRDALGGSVHLDDWLPGVSAFSTPFSFARNADSALRWAIADTIATTYNSQPAVLVMLSDVTAIKLAEQQLLLSEARMHLLLAKTPAVIFSAFAEGDYRTTFISESIWDVLGYTPAQFLADPGFWRSRVHPDDKAQLFSDVSQLMQQGWRQYEYRCLHADGSYHWIETGVSLLPAIAGHPAEVIGYMLNITERKQAEELLRQANRDMAHAARLKDEFLANMSHELRSPLNAILGFSESLQDAIYGPLTTDQLSAIRHIETSGRHLLALITDILDLSKGEAGRLTLDLEPVVIAEVCQASLLFVKELAVKKSLRLSLQLNDSQAQIEVDVRRLKQMLVNLLTNAVKFTPAGGQVSLEVRLDSAAGAIHFAVRDTGIGIAPEELSRLFQPFVQLDSSLSRQHEGTGLGLALVRSLAELHGGRVMVESELGKGSSFTLILPQHPSAPGAEQPALTIPVGQGAITPGPTGQGAVAQAPSAAGVRILLAEDNEPNIITTSDYLAAKGFTVIVARTGPEALAAAVEQRPDLILMDIQLPQLDGLTLTRQLRELPALESVPIIALTALTMPLDRERCLAAGASAYLSKPVRLQNLAELIQRLLNP